MSTEPALTPADLALILVAERRGAPMSPKLNGLARALARVMFEGQDSPELVVHDFAGDARELIDTYSTEALREAAKTLRANRAYGFYAEVLEHVAVVEDAKPLLAAEALEDMADRIDRGPTFPVPPGVISELVREHAAALRTTTSMES